MSDPAAVTAARIVRLIAQFAVLTTAAGATLFALGAVGQARFSDLSASNRSNPAVKVSAVKVSIEDGCPAVGRISAELEARRADVVVDELTRSPWFRRSVVHDLTDRWVDGSTVVAYSPCHPDRTVEMHSGNPGVAVVVDTNRTPRVVFINVP
jgi:hypothetical protein